MSESKKVLKRSLGKWEVDLMKRHRNQPESIPEVQTKNNFEQQNKGSIGLNHKIEQISMGPY